MPSAPPPASTIVLGNAEEAPRRDTLCGGLVTIASRHGIYDAERLLIDALPRTARRIVCVGDTEGVVALAAARVLGADAEVTHLALDLYDAARARRTALQNGPHDPVRAAADIPGARPDAPEPPFDAVLLVAPRESLLLRDLLEQAHDALAPQGRLLLAADRPPRMLHRLLKEVFGRCDRQGGHRDTHLFAARRTRSARIWQERGRAIARTIRGVDVHLWGRPGIFRADSIDAGTRALLERMEVPAGARVLDLGCGTGALGVGALLLGAREAVLVDSSLRAVDAAGRSAALSGVADRVQCLARADLEDLPDGMDLALANPPYYGDFRIARAFVEAAHRALRVGGRLWLVAKNAVEHEAIVSAQFGNARTEIVEGYGIIVADREAGAPGANASSLAEPARDGRRPRGGAAEPERLPRGERDRPARARPGKSFAKNAGRKPRRGGKRGPR